MMIHAVTITHVVINNYIWGHKIHGDEDDHDTFFYNNACNVVTWDDIV